MLRSLLERGHTGRVIAGGWARRVRVTVALALAPALALVGCRSTADNERRSEEVLVAVALEVDEQALAGLAASRDFRSLADVADRGGASPRTVGDAVEGMAHLGVTLTADATRSALWGKVDVSTAERVFEVDLVERESNGVRSIHPDGDPRTPDVPGVTGVIGLSRSWSVPEGSPDSPSTPASATPCPADAVTPSELAEKFGALAEPRGSAPVAVAVLSTERPLREASIAYDACTDGAPAPEVTSDRVPLSPRADGGTEIALDLVAVGSLAPGVGVDVIQFDQETSVVFPLLHLLDRASRTGATPDVLALTVGYCERTVATDEVALAERLLAALAATGTTAIAATGDLGSSGCHPESAAPAVQYPASSAWVTAVGGVSYDGAADSPGEPAVWNDTPDLDQAGGGGVSRRVARPAWQESLDHDGSGRLVPDLAAYAEPSGMGALPVCTAAGCTWQRLGGTSLAAAALAGLLAGELQRGGRRLGALSPLLARAASAGSAPTVDVTEGNNHVFSTRCCRARRGFDTASGWGLFTPRLLSAASRAARDAG